MIKTRLDMQSIENQLIIDIRPLRKSHNTFMVGLGFLREWLNESDVNLDPDYQRGHVWTEQQQTKFIEYILKSGSAQTQLQWNNPFWNSLSQQSRISDISDKLEIVDGKQRLTAILRFLDGEITAFGRHHDQFRGTSFDPNRFKIEMNIHCIDNRKDLLQFYLDLNSCGVVHSNEELIRIQNLIDSETVKHTLLTSKKCAP